MITLQQRALKGSQHTLCIKVPKVYDWVTRQVDVPVQSFIGVNGLVTLDFEGPTGIIVDPCAELDEDGPLTIECIITDEKGNPVNPLAPSAILCTEIPQRGGRQNIIFLMPNGEKITLQKVKILKKGYFVVRVSNARGKYLTSVAQPFAVTEKFFLCAPEGTFLQCEITDFDCDATIICSDTEFIQLDVSINLCQNVQMEAIVKLQVAADFCQPRREITFNCPPLYVPPQCPDIFPVNDC